MTDLRIKVLENQLDEMVGRVARVEEELCVLRKALARPRVLEILQLQKSDLKSVMASSLGATEQSRMSVARMRALAAARKDLLLNRLDAAERVADLTGKLLSDAWELGKKRRSTD